MSSAGGQGYGHEYGYDGEEPYNPAQYGGRSTTGRSMNAGGAPLSTGSYDGYSEAAAAAAAGAAGAGAASSGPRRHSSAAALDDYYRQDRRQGDKYSHDLTRRNRPMRGGRAYEYDDDDYASEDSDYDDRHRRHRGYGGGGGGGSSSGRYRSRSRGRDRDRNDEDDDDDDSSSKQRPRSLSAFGKRITTYLHSHGDDSDGADNTEGKKWGATLAGAVAGGLVGRMANKNTIAPAALGAFIGGFVAREGEKVYFKRKEEKEKADKRRIKYGAD